MELSRGASTSANTKCVECMCLMTLIQEHISSKHSNPLESCLYFELSEWQQAGYKQKIKWTLECDRCDFKTTSKSVMFEHIANHQILENTVQRLNQSSADVSCAPQVKPIMTKPQIEKPVYTPPQHSEQTCEANSLSITEPVSVQVSAANTAPTEDEVVVIKDEFPGPVLIHMEETDIDEMNNRTQQQSPPPLEMSSSRDVENEDCSQGSTSPQQEARCTLCNFTGPTSDSLMYHMRLEHKHFSCALCHYIGNKASDLEVHMREFHQSMLCIYCGVNGGNTRALRRHYSLDHGTRLKKCKRCNFATYNQTVLTHHVNGVHLGRRPRSCSYCDYAAYTDAAVRQHVIAIHKKQKPFSCTQCPMQFARKFQVKEHLKRKHHIDMSPMLSQMLNAGYKVIHGESTKPKGNEPPDLTFKS